MPAGLNPALRAVSDAVLAVASELSVEQVLQRLVESARELAGARYAALGIPDGEGGFAQFLVAGMGEELIASLGPMPRTHGMLGAMLTGPEPYRTDDIHDDPRFAGHWPRGHPNMRSFLGVPIIAQGDVIGAFYLTGKRGAQRFDDADEELIGVLAAHAAIAITNARLYEQSRELSVLSERNRLALELHDVVSQKLFSLTLSAEVVTTQLERDPAAARVQAERVKTLAREALEELRSLILGLRPPELERDGLAEALRKELELLNRTRAAEISLDTAAATALTPDSRRDFAMLRIAHEAVQNALRHARASHVAVTLAADRLVVTDDGAGFRPEEPELRARHLGLTSMEERAAELGGRLRIESAPGAGTTVTLELPRR